jgi:hypothetical protein
MLALLACLLTVAGCSQTKPEPIVVTKVVSVTLPPICRRPAPPLSPRPDRDLTQEEVFNNWSADRAARNAGETSRKACVDAVDAAQDK